MSDKLKWGILGYARIARNSFLPALMEASNSEFYAVASRDKQKLAMCRKDFGCRKYYASYDELLDDPEIQAVYIPLPNGMHKEWTIRAAQKGKHVLCEKPIALNSEECRIMMEECKRNNVKLMEAFMYRYSERTRMIRDLVESGTIGKVRHINSSFGFILDNKADVRFIAEQGGGSLYDVGCYPLNFFGMITNSSPISVSSESVVENGVDIMFSAILKYADDTICTLNCWFNAFLNVNTEIIGTKGIIKVPDTFFGSKGIISVINSNGAFEMEIKEENMYLKEIEDFAEAVKNDRSPLFSIEETYRNMKIIEQLLRRTNNSSI